jgi:malate dehydrogenase
MVGKGDVFGQDQPLILNLLDITPMMEVLEGVTMEIRDCALPLVREINCSDNPEVAFKDADAIFMVGAMPRKAGMERKDLLAANVKIFKGQGSAIEKVAKKTVKILVVGNPANTNALICSRFAPSIPKTNFSAMTRLDQNRAQAQVAGKCGVPIDCVKNCIIWGNHSSTQFPDVTFATVNKGGKESPAYTAVADDTWLKGEFIKTVQQRGAAIIAKRKLSSAMSAAKSACDHMRDWWQGTAPGCYASMAVISDGNKYGVSEGVMYSFPVTVGKDKNWKIVEGLKINDFQREKMDVTAKELVQERDDALDICK